MEYTKLAHLLGVMVLVLITIPENVMVFAGNAGCKSSCQNVPDGDYASCEGCRFYLTCANGFKYDKRPCPANLVWDDDKKRCEYTSSTCSLTTTTTSTPCFKCDETTCIKQTLVCDSRCDCRDCPDEKGCIDPTGVCGAGKEPVTNEQGVAWCTRVGYGWKGLVCPGPRDTCTYPNRSSFHGVCCRPAAIKPKPCCEKGDLTVNLRGRKPVTTGALKGVHVTRVKEVTTRACAHRVLITADFEKIDKNGCIGCLDTPFCGRRMLKVHLQLSGIRGGFLFNLGDSKSNNGFKGDAHHQFNDAEVMGFVPHIGVYGSDKCPIEKPLEIIIGGLGPEVNTVTMYVSNEYVLITNDNGQNYQTCNDCLFALNGQADNQTGGPNERIYLGINQVVSGIDRIGFGVCSVTLNWVCPECPFA